MSALESPNELSEFGLDVFDGLFLLDPVLELSPAFLSIQIPPLVHFLVFVVVLLEVHLPSLLDVVIELILHELLNIRALSSGIPSPLNSISLIHCLVGPPPCLWVLGYLFFIHTIVFILIKLLNVLIVPGGIIFEVLAFSLILYLSGFIFVDSDLFSLRM